MSKNGLPAPPLWSSLCNGDGFKGRGYEPYDHDPFAFAFVATRNGKAQNVWAERSDERVPKGSWRGRGRQERRTRGRKRTRGHEDSRQGWVGESCGFVLWFCGFVVWDQECSQRIWLTLGVLWDRVLWEDLGDRRGSHIPSLLGGTSLPPVRPLRVPYVNADYMRYL